MKKIVVGVLGLLVASGCYAELLVVAGHITDGNWSGPVWWNTDTASVDTPSVGDEARIGHVNVNNITLDVDGASTTVTLAAQGKLIQSANALTVGKFVAQAGGVYNMSGGTLSADSGVANAMDVQIDGEMNVSGAAMVTVAQRLGGAGTINLIGDNAQINVGNIAGELSGTLNFAFDASGTGQVSAPSWMELYATHLTVDGSAYAGAAGSFVLIDSSNLASALATYSVTGLGSEGVGWTLDQNLGAGAGLGDVVLTIIPEPATLGLVAFFGAGMLFLRRLKI